MTLSTRLPALSIALLTLTLAACAFRRPQTRAFEDGGLADIYTVSVEMDGVVTGQSPAKTVEVRNTYGNLGLTSAEDPIVRPHPIEPTWMQILGGFNFGYRL